MPTLLNMESKEKISNVKFVKDYNSELNKIRLEMDREFSKMN
jgi:hypothetical protein